MPIKILTFPLIGAGPDMLETKVNLVLEEHPGATVEWRSAPGEDGHGKFTELTAIIAMPGPMKLPDDAPPHILRNH